MKLYYPNSRVTVSQIFFSVRVVQIWYKLPEEVVSTGSVSAFISHPNSMHVSFFNVFLCNVFLHLRIFRAVVSAFLGLSVQSTQFCFLLYLLYCICVDEINIHSKYSYIHTPREKTSCRQNQTT